MTEKSELRGLIRQIQDGDRDAFGALYDRFFDSVYGYVLRQVGSSADAEDITAGVFLEVFEKIGGFTWRGAGFSAWLFRIARNDVLDHFRQRSPAKESALMEEIEQLPAAATVDQQAEKKWSAQELLAAITRLSEEQRQVVLLKLTLNFSNRQTGVVLGKSEGAIKALQHRALLSLREILDEGKGR